MLIRSQPLDDSVSERLKLRSEDEIDSMSEQNIKAQRIGRMFDCLLDDLPDSEKKRSVGLSARLYRIRYRFKNVKSNIKYTIRNHLKWRKTMRELRPWEGFDGLFKVMLTHLRDYVQLEEMYGHSAKEYKETKIASVYATLELLVRMSKPDEYAFKRRDEVDSRYPDYKYLITEYESGGVCYSGDFVPLHNGWVGMESGKDPRNGYFEFVDGKFELAESPDQRETDRLIDELRKYHEEVHTAYEQAEIDSDKDFENLLQLLKDNLYTWWD